MRLPRSVWFGASAVALLVAFLINISFGATRIPVLDILRALLWFDADNYDHFVIVFQRLPRSLIAIYLGAVMACGGAVLQGLTRNPLASPALIGINSGATLFVVAGSMFVSLSPRMAWGCCDHGGPDWLCLMSRRGSTDRLVR